MKQINKNFLAIWTVSMLICAIAIFFGDTQVVVIFAGIALIVAGVNIVN